MNLRWFRCAWFLVGVSACQSNPAPASLSTDLPSDTDQGSSEATDLPSDTDQGSSEATDLPSDTGQGASEATDLPSDTGQGASEQTITLPRGQAVSPNLGLGEGAQHLRILSGSLPAGVFLDGDGRAWGRPTRVENRQSTIEWTATSGEKRSVSVQWQVRSGSLAALPLEDPVARTGVPWQVRLEAVDGRPPFTWTVLRGHLPRGISLDEAGLLSGVPEEEGVFPLWIRVTDSEGATADLVTAVRVGPEPILASHGRTFEENADARTTPQGMVLSAWPDGSYRDHGDSAIWTGVFLAGMAFEAALTGRDHMMRKTLEGLRRCREITGVPGVLCRGIEHDEWVGRTAEPNLRLGTKDVHASSVPEYEGWRFLGDVSRDQWSGVFLGLGLVHRLAQDPGLRQVATEGLVDLAVSLWRQGLTIRDVDGRVTEYGQMSPWRFDGDIPGPNGMNAAMVLAWTVAALEAARGAPEEEVLARGFAELVTPPPDGWDPLSDPGAFGAFEAIESLLYPYLGECEARRWYNVHITHLAFFQSALWLPDGPIRDRLVSLWREGMWKDQGDTPLQRRSRSEANPWFTFLYLGASTDEDPEALFEALDQMARFPPPPRVGKEIHNSEDPRFPHDPECPGWAFEALPVAERCSGGNFVWQRNPYLLDCWGGVGQEHAGTDFVAPYWLGVGFGFLDPRL